MSKRLAIFVLLAACSVAFSQQPQAAYSFDLKAHGFVVNKAVGNLTKVAFITDNQIGVHISERSGGKAWFNKLLVFDVASLKTLTNGDDFPCPVIWANDKLFCFQSRQVDIYGQDLNLLAHYETSLSTNPNSDLDLAARTNMVRVSPDQLRISIPVDGNGEILSTQDFRPVLRVSGRIVALGNDHWVVQKTFGSNFTEQVEVNSEIKDTRTSSENLTYTYLGSNVLFRLTKKREMNIEDEEGHLLHSLGKTPAGDLFVTPDRVGRHFATEVFVEKFWDLSGTAQYKKILLRVFETSTGKEIFHLREVPSENEPTFKHYVALSPSGTRLAVIRNGVLKIYKLPR